MLKIKSGCGNAYYRNVSGRLLMKFVVYCDRDANAKKKNFSGRMGRKGDKILKII